MDNPVCLIVGLDNFLGLSVAENLKQKNIEVVTEAPVDSLEYVICFTSEKKAVTSAVDIAHQNRAKFAYCAGNYQPDIEAYVATKAQELNLDARILRAGYVFGPGMHSWAASPLQTLFSRIDQKEIILLGEPSREVYPIFVTDAAELLAKSLFSRAAKQKIFSLAGPEATSLINLALKLQKIARDHGRTLELVDKPTSKDDLVPGISGQRITPKTALSLDKGLELVLDSIVEKSVPTPPKRVVQIEAPPLAAPTPPTHKRELSPPPPPAPPKSPIMPKVTMPKVVLPKIPKVKFAQKSKHVLAIFTVLLLALGVFAGILIAPFLLLSFTFRQANQLTVGDITDPKVEKIRQNLQSHLQLSQETLRFLANSNVLPALINQLGTEVKLVSEMGSTNIKALKVKYYLLQAVDRILGQENGDPYSALTEAKSHLDSLYTSLSLITGRTAPQEFALLTDSQTEKFINTLPEDRLRINIARQLLNAFPSFISPTQKTSYLILIQNNLELRPTGGFIGAIGILSFDKGRLLNYEVKDIYEADAALKGRVDPPPEINKYLGEQSWYLRDVNWDPHFPTTSRNAQWFLEKELNRTVNGVIAINLYTLKSLLMALGEITAGGQTITAQNLEETVQYYQDVDFSANSKKQELLGQITSALIEKLKTAPGEARLAAFDALLDSALRSNLLIAPNDQNGMRVVSDLGISGELISPTCPPSLKSSDCLTDFLMVNEANVGINKANFYLARKQNHTINIAASTITHTHSLTLHNTAQNQSWPAGNYKSYIRFYVPSDSQLVRVLIDKSEVSADKINVYNEHGKTIIGVYAEVPFNNFQTIEVSYRLPGGLPAGSPVAYTFLMQKQPGTFNDPVNLKVTYPPGTTPITISHQGENTSSSSEISTTLEKNIFFAVELAR